MVSLQNSILGGYSIFSQSIQLHLYFIMQIIILALLFGAANAVDCSTTGGSASCAAADNMAVSVMNHFLTFSIPSIAYFWI